MAFVKGMTAKKVAAGNPGGGLGREGNFREKPRKALPCHFLLDANTLAPFDFKIPEPLEEIKELL